MTYRRLYNIGISSRSQTQGEETARQQTATQGTLEGSTGSVTSVATEPGEESLVVGFAGPYVEQMVAELTELANAGEINEVPYFAVDTDTPSDAYVTVSQARSGRSDPRFPESTTFNGTLTKIGTSASHRRSVSTGVSDVSHPFGNDQTAYVGIPSTSTKVVWYDPIQAEKEEPTLVETRNAEHGDVDIYDAAESTFYDPPDTYPELVFKLPYEDEGTVDARAWDTHGEDSVTNDEDVVQWQTVYVDKHAYVGDAVLTNGLVRLTFDEDAPSLSAGEWDDSSSAWTSTSLGTSDWAFYDLDVREISLTGIKAVVEFSNPAADPTEYYNLQMTLKRGWEYPLWSEIEGGVPGGLVDLLSPVASSSAYDPSESQGLRQRSDL